MNGFNNNSYKEKKQKNKKSLNSLTLKILGVIPVLKVDLDKVNIKLEDKESPEEKSEENKEKNPKTVSITKILKLIVHDKELKLKDIKDKLGEFVSKMYVEKLNLSFGFNTNDYVKNAYINASLNSIICLYINHKRDNFDFNRLYYKVYISNYSYYLDLHSIIKAKSAETIYMIYKLVLFMKNELSKDKVKEEEKVWKSTQ